ncbi:hypothetical protein N7499_011011 [Penicillium canescens]|uniref:Uncharacterized protein n=1 Tax=Penicillium canescens TaxID=5083 RepID=A0AAD6IK01_PENCN|nr:hypothetical protein N7460_002202 [Penicillium canescens]KAJ6065430.1 hypothetical protein N7444_001083 [Penicillium canescens]KAJ6069124.1 hypothetical protein N7499_011011 [Penicillium canescens]KAJ6182824.1 hypothetical protein N7485_001466 [Penicillium canescens]
MSSESGSERSGRLNAGLSGFAAGGPVDGEVKAENKSTLDKKAVLAIDEVVKRERFITRNNVVIAQWIKDNAKKPVKSAFGDDIAYYGLYAVHTTYVTSQCAIMTTDKSRNLDLGLDVGATGIAKLGVGGSSLQKLKSEGWATYESKEVISTKALGFEIASLILCSIGSQGRETTELRAIYDENGNITQYEEVKVEAPKEEESFLIANRLG